MKKSLIILLILISGNLFAQEKDLSSHFLPGMMLVDKKYESTGPNGRIFLYEDWKEGSFYTFDGDSLTNYPLLVNLYHHQTVVKINSDAKSIDHSRVKRIHINEKDFYTSQNFKMDTEEKGIFEILYDNEHVKIANFWYIVRIEANYNIQMNVGNREDTYKLKNISYIIIGQNAYKIPNNRNKFALLFSEQNNEMQNFIKNKKIKPKNFTDLIKTADYFKLIENTEVN